MALGILDQLGLAATLIFAIPVAAYGLQQAAGGSLLVGAAFVVVAALMVYLPQRLTTPGDIPGKAAEKAVDTALGSENEGSETGAGSGPATNGDGGATSQVDAAPSEDDAAPSDDEPADRT